MTDDLPPLKFCVNLLIGVLLFLLTLLLVYTPSAVPKLPQQPTISVKTETIPNGQFVLINNNSVLGLASPPGNDKVSASLTGIDELDRIIQAESSNRYWVKNPRSSAYGYCQFIKKTRDYVEEKWKMTIDWQSPEEQLYACKRLYLEEGNRHWNESKYKWDK